MCSILLNTLRQSILTCSCWVQISIKPTKLFFMIPVLIIWLLRRFRQRRSTNRSLGNNVGWCIISILLIALMLLMSVKEYAQNKQFNYQILRNGNKVGTLNFSETKNGGMDYLKMVSDVKT